MNKSKAKRKISGVIVLFIFVVLVLIIGDLPYSIGGGRDSERTGNGGQSTNYDEIKKYNIDYKNFQNSYKGFSDLLNEGYYEWKGKKENKNKWPGDFVENLGFGEDNAKKAVAYVWAANKEEGKAKEYLKNADDSLNHEGIESLHKAIIYRAMADTASKNHLQPEIVNDYKINSLSNLKDYYTNSNSDLDPYDRYMGLKRVADQLDALTDLNETQKERVDQLMGNITSSLSGWEKISWGMSYLISGAELGAQVSNALYEWWPWYKERVDSWQSFIGDVLGDVLGFDFKKWSQDLICANLKLPEPLPFLYTSQDGRMGSFIAGKKTKIKNLGLYLYRLTFMINTALNPDSGEIKFGIRVYDENNKEYYLDLNRNGEPDIWIETSDAYYSTRDQPHTWYSSIKLDKACIIFKNVDGFKPEFRRLLEKHDNKICAPFAEEEPIYEEEGEAVHLEEGSTGNCIDCGS